MLIGIGFGENNLAKSSDSSTHVKRGIIACNCRPSAGSVKTGKPWSWPARGPVMRYVYVIGELKLERDAVSKTDKHIGD